MSGAAVAVPSPPVPFDPIREVVPAGTVLFRVHEPVLDDGTPLDGVAFNPGVGRSTRFAFFGDPVVPVLYAADHPEAAVHESVLHDVDAGGYVPAAEWRSKVLSAVEVVADLEVVALHSDGLRRFGLTARDLTDTPPTAYPATVRWAEAAWAAGADGVSYMSRHFNTSGAVCLFGDRDRARHLAVVPDHVDARAFETPADAEWVAGVAASIRVRLGL